MDYMTVADLADRLGLHHDTTRRIAVEISQQIGVTPERRQVSPRTRRRVLCWTRDDAGRILAERSRQGFNIDVE